MRLYGVRIFVDDHARATAFYRDTLGLPVEFEMAEHGVAGYRVGAAVLIVEAEAPGAPFADLVGRFVGISLEVDDIHQTHRDLVAAGVVFDRPPEKQFWGGTLADFRDPAGNVLTLLGA